MATSGSNSSASTDGGLDMTFDTLCSQCMKNDQQVKSAMFCVQCKDLFCLVCSKKHTKVAASKHHNLVRNHEGRKSLRSLSRSSLLKDFNVCSKHLGNRFTKFCKEDNSFCCPDCVRNDHKLCSEFFTIPSEIYTDELKKRLKEYDPTLKNIKTKLESLRKENTKTVRILESQKAQILQTIKDYRKRIDELFDKLELSARGELDERFKECSASIEQTMKLIQTLIDDQTNLDKKAKQDLEIFVKVQKTNDHISEANRTIQRLEAAKGTESIVFNIDPSVSGVLQSIMTFGAFSSTPHEYKLMHRGDFDITDTDIGPEPNFNAVCLPDGKVVICSSSCRKILLLSTSFRIISNTLLDGTPGGICRTSPKEIVVCLPYEKTLQYLYAERNIKSTRSFKLEIECFSVAYHDGELYVTSRGRGTTPAQVYIYNMSAKLLRTIGNDMFREPLFFDPNDIAISIDGSKIYVSDGNMGLLCLTKMGILVKKHMPKYLDLPYGITVDPAGNAFVCGTCSDNILQLSAEGYTTKEILQEKDGLNGPLSVCLDYKRSLLIVTLKQSKQIKVYSMT